MIDDEDLVFEQVLDVLDLPEPDQITKERIMKAVYVLMVAKEIGLFHLSIPEILLSDRTYE